MLGRLKKNGHRIVRTEEAQTVIVNTCSFIEEARKESIDTILDLIELKKAGQDQKSDRRRMPGPALRQGPGQGISRSGCLCRDADP